MSLRWMICWSIVLACFGTADGLAIAQDRPKDGPGVVAPPSTAAIFKPLKVGQKVSVEERPGGQFDVMLLNDGAIGAHTVIELGANHLVVEDIAAVSRRWIPLTSIRAVVWTRVPTR